MPIRWTEGDEANELLERDPLALLVGMVLDQQVKMEKAFAGPYELQRRIGPYDAARIAGMDPDELDRAFRERPALHRFPGNMAKRVQAMAKHVAEVHGGDPEAIWKDAASGEELYARVRAIPGFGDEKSKIFVAVLAKKFGVRPPGWEKQAASWHTIADVDSEESMEEAKAAKREIKAARR